MLEGRGHLAFHRPIVLTANTGKENEKAPDYNIRLNDMSIVEIGAGWDATSKDGNPYIKVKIDDPSLPNTLWAALTASEDGSYTLLWTRPNGKTAKPKAEKATL